MKSISKNLESIADNIVILFVVALFLIDFIPRSESEDIIYSQFFYLAGLNFIIALYISFKAKFISSDIITTFKKSSVFWLFSTFVILCGLSIITAINTTLAIEKLTELIIAFCLLVNFTMLLKNRLHLIPKIILIICIVAFLQSVIELYNFKRNFDKVSISVALSDLAVRTGNINILAASLTIKIPFLLLGFTHYLRKKRIFLFITLLLVTTTILLTAARTAILSTILVYVLFIVYNLKINSFNKATLLKVAGLIIPVIIALGISSSIFKKTENSRYVSVAGRLEQINTSDASANARLVTWQNTFELAKTKPLTGVGLGNYKIESIPYEKEQNDNSTISLHTHNDFLELMAETGFVNGFIYIAMFIMIVFINAKRFFKSEDREIQSLAMLTLMATVVYGMDALLNFPMFRATMLIFLCIIIIFTIINVAPTKNSDEKLIKNNFYWLFAIVSAGTIYFAFLGYKASGLEYLIKKDDGNGYKNAVLTGDEVINSIPKFKNTLTTAESFYEYAAIYYYNENKMDQSLKYLTKADKINPYFGRILFYKMLIANKKGNIDSAFVYGKQAFYMRPRNINFYTMSLQFARAKNDTTEIFKEHRLFTKYRNIPQAWDLAATELKNANYDNNKLLNFLDKGIKQFPNDSTLLEKKSNIISVEYIGKAQAFLNAKNKEKALEFYNKALKADPKNADIMQYLGFFYYNAGDYKQSANYFLKALELREFNNGRTEFFIANCYLYLKDKVNACKYYEISNSKNFPDAKQQLIQNCK
ncbi:O-antigen ligase family protein [Flavobacterium branchiicola]|uniref:O-antigen ligase family protein n=1 Tax=Flavobacterium branchiicola TaxID=1114875 RepID=A0ABV9PFA6_9FLAO|nr:O-antigen ligase family protein [Flavobacterium branchiicola]MBS7253867.1 O-antigen ligase family protein [Flavobacterium branchiicola]